MALGSSGDLACGVDAIQRQKTPTWEISLVPPPTASPELRPHRRLPRRLPQNPRHPLRLAQHRTMSCIPPNHSIQPVPYSALHILDHLFCIRNHLRRTTLANHVRCGYVSPRRVARRASEHRGTYRQKLRCPVRGLGLGEVLVEEGFGCCGVDGECAGLRKR